MNLRLTAWFALSALIVALDQLSKWLVLSTLSYGQALPVTGFFQLVLVFNPGATFSLLADQSGWQRWFFVVLAVLVCGWLAVMLRHHYREFALPLAFSLIIGGAIGNVIDRLMHGAVVDFLYFHVAGFGWPAFNVADAAITIGVALLLWSHFRPRRSRPLEDKSDD